MVGGVGLAAWAVASASAEDVAIDRPATLVTSGAFAVSRNPMYQGWGLAVIGLGTASRSAWLLAAGAVASVAIDRAILGEEDALSREFGTGYASYSSATPRYLTPQGAVALLRRMVRDSR
jgi:protein-S-isoprenylcysteine O-methyltransferase Ste14